MKFPKNLKKGDTIGLVCASGFMPLENVTKCIQTLKTWGYNVVVGKTVGHQNNYFSGTDEERLADLQNMLDDANINAILFARGGYGLSRIIDQINFKAFKEKPKWLIGYSDISILHCHIHRNFKIATLHAPMAAAFNDEGYKNEFVQSIQKTLKGSKAKYFCNAHEFNQIGNVKGELIGGNLSLINHTLATNSVFLTKNKILFVEDIGEYIYHIDRLFVQLKRSGFLNNLNGLIIGGFTEMKDTIIPFGKTIEEVIHEQVKEFSYPICFHFPVGHQTENYALKIGVEYELNVTKNKVSLKEI